MSRKVLVKPFLILIAFSFSTAVFAQKIVNSVNTWSNSSVLKTGDWYKISIEESGIYKLTPSFLSDANINNDGNPISINNLRIFGNGDEILPASNSIPRKDDINEIPCKIVDANSNGTFDGNDYLLFYAKDPHEWLQVGTSPLFKHTLNFYRDLNFYYITVNNGVGSRVVATTQSPGTPNTTVLTYDDYSFIDDDKENLVGAGRTWVGDVFDFTLDYNYGFNFPDLDKTSAVSLKVVAVARSSDAGTLMEITQSGSAIGSRPFPAYSSGTGANYVTYASQDPLNFSVTNDDFSINLQYNNSTNPSGVAWLDYLEVQVRRNLRYRGEALYFRDLQSMSIGNVAEYQISNATNNIEIWDVTNINNVFSISTQLNNSTLSFTATADSLRDFIAFSGSNFPIPEFVNKLENQNLHSLSGIEMLIVSHPDFSAAAERLAQLHRDEDNMTVEVVGIDEVYNEFSSGGQDITAIRDFTRMLYSRNNGGANDLKYLLLMGDASYDYRDRLTNNNNYIPIWQDPLNPFSLYNSSITDDYYGLLDLNEGGNLSNGLLDIGIGRIPCETISQSESYIDKIVHYVTGEQRFGDWRNKILLMADDVDETWEPTFVITSEKLEKAAKETSNSFIVEKIYTDAYKQVSTSGSESYPEASADMFRKIQQGNLVTNYIGHGGEIGLSSEKLLKLSDVNAWSNYDAMPLFITITCEFTRVDDPKRVSAGEQLLLNPNGGAIGLISTTRVVDVQTATTLNLAVFDSLLTRNNNLPKRLGDIIKDSKNGQQGNPTRLKFSLFGDPAMRLAIPRNKIQTNSINKKPIASGQLDTIKALSKVEIQGQVNDVFNNKISNFNGVLNVSVFDKPNERQTLANDGVKDPINFQLQNNLIYRGKVEVVNGDFTIEFISPLDISYKFGFGKISYYSNNEVLDAAGFYDTIVIGGFNPDAKNDGAGPVVRLFMNDESFVRGGITGTDPVLLAVLSDSSGINTVGNSVGHDIVAVIDDNTEQSFVVNDFYEADLNSFKSGRLRYPIFDLEPGSHNLKLKVFDIHNNFTKAETDFIVAESEKLALERVLNYPNPFTTYTEFQFEHNRVNQPLDVQVQVFTVSGKLVKTINSSIVPTGNRVTGISWNGLDDYGDKIGKGVYVYKVKVRSQLDNLQAEEYEKLVILR